MKLELKHLAPYLPYGLKCKSTTILFGEEDSGVYEMGMISMRGVLKGTGKPILRPLKEIYEVERIMNEFSEYHLENFANSFFIVGLECTSRFDNLSVTQYECMLKHHFDVFGLIDKGLAIDINTL